MLASTSDDDHDVMNIGGFSGVTQKYTYGRLYNLYLDPKETRSYMVRKLAYLEAFQRGDRQPRPDVREVPAQAGRRRRGLSGRDPAPPTDAQPQSLAPPRSRPVLDTGLHRVFICSARDRHSYDNKGLTWFLTVFWPLAVGWIVGALITRVYTRDDRSWLRLLGDARRSRCSSAASCAGRSPTG